VAFPFGVDAELLLAATSFITNFNGKKDPRAAAAFAAFATAYCNGSDVILPLRSQRAEGIPDFRTLWLKRPGVKTIACAELSDKDFEAAAAMGAAHFAEYAESDAANVARWLEFEFSPAVTDVYHDESDAEAIVRCAELARELIETQKVPRLAEAIGKIQREHLISVPRLYMRLGGEDDCPTLMHLCLAYAIRVALGGYAALSALSAQGDSPLYRHHWTRSAMVQRMGADEFRADAKQERMTQFPWGEILRRVFNSDAPFMAPEPQGVGEVMDAIRSKSERVQKDLQGSLFKKLLRAKRDRTSEAEEIAFEVLREVDVFPKEAKKIAMQKQKALCSLKEMAPADGAPFESSIETISAKLPKSGLKMRFRRDRFWAEMEEAGIRK